MPAIVVSIVLFSGISNAYEVTVTNNTLARVSVNVDYGGTKEICLSKDFVLGPHGKEEWNSGTCCLKQVTVRDVTNGNVKASESYFCGNKDIVITSERDNLKVK